MSTKAVTTRKPRPSPVRDSIDMADVIKRTFAGQTYTEIARACKVPVMTLYDAIHAADDAVKSAHARARLESAEALLDEGLRVVKSSLRKDGAIDPTAARAYAHECARRAGIRNPQYRERGADIAVNVGVRVGAAQMSDADLARVIEGDKA